MISVRVNCFKPSVDGFQFGNQWPPGTPDYIVNILGQNVTIGSAANGLCGGMVYAVADIFEAGDLPPAITTPPAAGTSLFTYIVARLTNSFDWDDVNQYLSWIQMSDHDTGFDTPFGHVTTARGLAWHEITEEWPKIKADLDGGSVSLLGLVHGQEPPTIGFITGLQDLGGCHQVLAWGYDLDGTNLTIYIYDPDNTGDGNTITLDIGNPAHTTPISVSQWPNGTFRGFFRTHYQFHDPTTPASGSLVGIGVVSSPGLTGLALNPCLQPPPPQLLMIVTASPFPVPLNTPVALTVSAEDAATHVPLDGTVTLLNYPGPKIISFPTGKPFQVTLGLGTITVQKRINMDGSFKIVQVKETIYPGVTVSVPKYRAGGLTFQ